MDIERPTRRMGSGQLPRPVAGASFMLGLAPDGVFTPLPVTRERGGLLPRLFTSHSDPLSQDGADFSLLHFPSEGGTAVLPAGQHSSLAYRKASCPMVPGLSSPARRPKRLPDLLSRKSSMKIINACPVKVLRCMAAIVIEKEREESF
jgi:hypothetical protein